MRQAILALAAAAGTIASVGAGLGETPTPPAAVPREPAAWVKDIGVYERSAWKRDETLCDRLAAHPEDPEKVSPGVTQAAMDVPAAIAACQAGVAADPANPRLNYQLARAFGYAGRHADGAPSRQRAVMSGYPQSLFVVGFILVTGWGGTDTDPCTGGALIRLSADAGRKAGLIGYPHYVVNGALTGCALAMDKALLTGYLTRARPMAQGYYEGLLLDNLAARVASLP
jgi:hypothetical protein